LLDVFLCIQHKENDRESPGETSGCKGIVIMAMDKSRYPANWNQISRERRERANQRCEWCDVPNGIWVCRKRGTTDYVIETLDDDVVYRWPDGSPIRLSELPAEYDYDKPTKIVLSVAHLGVDYPDGTPGNKHDKMDCRPENLAALCQRCHLLYDIDEHVTNARVTRRRKKREAEEQRS
jgi:hypothetical protein